MFAGAVGSIKKAEPRDALRGKGAEDVWGQIQKFGAVEAAQAVPQWQGATYTAASEALKGR